MKRKKKCALNVNKISKLACGYHKMSLSMQKKKKNLYPNLNFSAFLFEIAVTQANRHWCRITNRIK